MNEKIDANKIADLKIKFANFSEFIVKMSERMTMGTMKYGDQWKFADIPHEIEQEILDVAIYAYLLWLRIMKIKEKMAEDGKNEER